MIEVRHLTKRYGPTLAVDDLSFRVQPGVVTGFLGPNGAGKSTTLRIVLGLDRPTAGTATVDGRAYAELDSPLRHVGALLDARAVHPTRRARDHLRGLARSNGIALGRVDEVLETTGLGDVADRRAGDFSLGMAQRLGIAGALLGDPGVLVLDEPVNGLDTEGIRWVRTLLRDLASEGRTVLVSSHVMSEMELSAERLVVVGRGRLLADTTVRAVVDGSAHAVTRVRSAEPGALRRPLERAGAEVTVEPDGAWQVSGPDAAAIGRLAVEHGVALHELTPSRASLEEVYTAMTHDAVAYRTAEPEDAR